MSVTINKYEHHPFKQGLIAIIYSHFAFKIAKRFEVFLEVELYNPNHERGGSLRKQIKDNNFIAEVHYRHDSGLLTYVCDVNSWWTREQCEYALLKFITDKARIGEIGKDWTQHDLKNISSDITSGKYETPDSEIQKGMIDTKVSKEVKK